MGMTLWLHVLHERTIDSDETDYSSLWRFAKHLDAICAELGQPLFSSFFDHTDAKYNLTGGMDDALDPETGWAYGIDETKGFDVTAGLVTLRALETHLKGDADALGLNPKQVQMLLEELREVSQKLEAATSGARFHLELVM